MSDPPVLFAGATRPAAIDDLVRVGVGVAEAPSVLAALSQIRAGSEPVVVADGGELIGREQDTFRALRDAGARGVVALYGPEHQHRARRAVAQGADAAVVLPSHPGELPGVVRSLLRRPRTAAPVSSATPAMESLFGDVALLHRSVGDPERLLDHVHALFRRRGQARRVSLLVLDRRAGQLVMQRASGLTEDAAWGPVPLGEGFAGRVAESGRPLLVRDIQQLGAARGAAVAQRAGYESGSFVVLPLAGTTGVVAVVCLADRADGRPFEASDLRSLSVLGDQAGQALENALELRHVRDLSVIDELTGLYNRRFFRQALTREVQRARRYDRPVTLAIFDLDHFKLYNDRCGHAAGDRALAKVGELLRTSLRDVDIVARHGGEEFAVLLPETAAGADVTPFPFVERLRRRVADAVFEGEEKLPGGSLTLSGGLACFPADAGTADDLFELADQALYASKAAGRNRITYRGHGIDE